MSEHDEVDEADTEELWRGLPVTVLTTYRPDGSYAKSICPCAHCAGVLRAAMSDRGATGG